MNDVERRVARLNPVPPDAVKGAARTPEALRLLQNVLDEPILGPALPPSHARGLRRPHATGRHLRLPVIVGVSLVLAGAAIGWALTTTSARDTVSVQCEIEGSDTIIPSITGDPVADCAAQWRRDTDRNPPPLVAYDNGHGGITVAPAGQAPLPGARPLPGGATQNVSIVEVQQSLDDFVRGLNSGCFDNRTASEMTTRILARFGMEDWTVRSVPSTDVSSSSAAPAAPQGCVGAAILDPAIRTVVLRALGGTMRPGAPYERLAERLRSVAEECMPLDATAKRVRSIADELGLSEAAHEYQLTEIPENDAPCTTVNETVGGTIFLILRGPATT
jgi:hypothetical protein